MRISCSIDFVGNCQGNGIPDPDVKPWAEFVLLRQEHFGSLVAKEKRTRARLLQFQRRNHLPLPIPEEPRLTFDGRCFRSVRESHPEAVRLLIINDSTQGTIARFKDLLYERLPSKAKNVSSLGT